MLEKIVLNNYKTFFNETPIDFNATNYKILESDNVGDERILKGCLFVGENASGKTNILKAIKLLLTLLFKDKNVSFIEYKNFYSINNKFSIDYYFVCNKNRIKYSIELGLTKKDSNYENTIFSERLSCNSKDVIIRLGSNAKFIYNNEEKDINISSSVLALRSIYFDTKFYDDETLNTWMKYLENSISINCYSCHIDTYNNNESLLVHNYLGNKGVDEINDFFKKINYNETISYGETTANPKGKFNMSSSEKFISFNKSGTDMYIPEIFESTGNHTLVELLPTFFYATKNDCMIILDEFSSGLHNELEECLLKYFFHYSNNSQIFFASHSTNILKTTILRPDQIYSVSFDSKKGSFLKRFSDENPRESQNQEKMYLNGVFDGMPHYNKVFKD